MRKYRATEIVKNVKNFWGDYNITPYTDADYQGEFNLTYAERELMCEAMIRTKGDQGKARELLGVNEKKW